MMKAAAVALASGLLVPPAQIYVPPKPAIIKPESLEFSKNLLAMPLTMGAVAKAGGVAAITGVMGTYTSTTAGSTHTFTGVDFGTGGGWIGFMVTLSAYAVYSSAAVTSPTSSITINVASGSASYSGPHSLNIVAGSSTVQGTATLSFTFDRSVSNCAVTVYRAATTMGVPSSVGSNTSATNVFAITASALTTTTGNIVLASHTHDNTMDSTLQGFTFVPTNAVSGNQIISTRMHSYYVARAGTVTSTGSVQASWMSTSAVASIVATPIPAG